MAAQIKPGAVVKNSVVLSHTVVGENAHIENQVMDKWAKVVHGNEIIAEEGPDGFIAVENRINSEVEAHHSVIATGGSVVYGKRQWSI